jgi:AAA family ATP:ADP antiporter
MEKAANSPQTPKSEFHGLRGVLWPIHNYELKKFLPMAFMMLFTLFIYNVARNAKDTMVINAPCSGAEALSFIKLAGTLPFAIILMIAYTKLSNKFSREKLFYGTVTFFMAFFALFGFVLHPHHENIHMSVDTMKSLQASYPAFKWAIACIGNWSFSLFYMFAELWGTMGLTYLFWQFANEICKTSEAKRHYAMYGLIGNFGLIFSGAASKYFAQICEPLEAKFSETYAWQVNLEYLVISMLISGVAILVLYAYMQKAVLTDPRLYDPTAGGKKKKSKPKLGVMESVKYVINSPYLRSMAVLVLAYGVGVNIVEAIYKAEMKQCFPSKVAFNSFMGNMTFATGVATILIMVGGSNILRRLRWATAASATPIMILVTSLIFFGLIIYTQNSGSSDLTKPGSVILMTIVWVGLSQNVLSKSTKYSLFDPTKEMAYIPLDDEMKVKGKAAVDIVGGRAGKSGGAVIQMAALAATGASLPELAPIFGLLVIGVVIAWLISIGKLSTQYEAAVAEQKETTPAPTAKQEDLALAGSKA